MIVGGFWVGIAGFLRYARGVNETISSLLLTYIGIAIMNFFVEGALRDLSNPNKPSTKPLGDAYMVGKIPGTDVHWGFAAGVVLCILLYLLLERTTFGFAARVTGGNYRAALAQGLPVGKLIVACAAIAGACGRARRLLRGRGDPGPRQRFACRGLRLHRHSGVLPRPSQSAGHSSGRDPVRRHRRFGRPDPAAHGAAGRDGAGARRPDLRRAADLRDALWPLLDLQAAGREGSNMSDAILTVLVAMLGGAIRVSTPFMFVALGECLTEKSGRVNLGLEGTLVMGAMVGYAASYHTGSPWLGVLAAGVAGSALGAMHGSICGLPKVNDVAVGIAMMLFGVGLAFFFGKPYIQPTAPRLDSIPLGFWSDSVNLKSALQVNPLFFVGIVVAVVLAWALRNTRWGLVVRTVGDSAPAARAMGISVNLVRLLTTTVGGFLAGVGGAFLSLSYPGSWNQGLSSGQGLMAVALVIFARWSPVRCVYAALLFGAAGAIGPSLQSIGVTQGYYFFNAAPYILTLAIMIATSSATHSARDMPGELSMSK